jgi:pimeloyl-ACP methyl ester carboxylesterase/uncharacterized protein YegL
MKITRAIALLSASLALSGCTYIQSSGLYHGTQVTASRCPERVLFVLDVSGSMEDKQETGLGSQATGAAGQVVGGRSGQVLRGALNTALGVHGNKLDQAKGELRKVINGLSRDSYFNIVTFSNGVRSWSPEFAPSTAGRKRSAIAFLEGTSAEGGTATRSALQHAFGVQNVDVIYLLSDGNPTDAGPPAIIEEIRRLNQTRRVTINTIGVGNDRNSEFLCTLARNNQGTYRGDGRLDPRCGSRPLVIFIGGLGDQTFAEGNEQSMVSRYCEYPHRRLGHDKEYYAHDDHAEITNRIVERQAASLGTPIALVGHSYGASTAYAVAASLPRNPISLLVTLDPVSRNERPSQSVKPANVSQWVNAWVQPKPTTRDERTGVIEYGSPCENAAAGAGGHWGAQRGARPYDYEVHSPHYHCATREMLGRAYPMLEALGRTQRR